MMLLPIPIKWLTILLAIQILGVQTPEMMSAELKPKTVEAFDRYVQLTEARINREVSQTEKFLYLDELPPPRRSEVLSALQRGEIFMERRGGGSSSRYKNFSVCETSRLIRASVN